MALYVGNPGTTIRHTVVSDWRPRCFCGEFQDNHRHKKRERLLALYNPLAECNRRKGVDREKER